MKKILIGILIILILGAITFISLRDKNNELKFKTEKVLRGDIEATVTATGTVNPVTTVLVGTQVSGTIKNIYVDFNSPVKKGEVIAQIEDARINLDRIKRLWKEGLASQKDMDSSQYSYDSQIAQMKSLEAKHDSIIAQLNAAEAQYKTSLAQ